MPTFRALAISTILLVLLLASVALVSTVSTVSAALDASVDGTCRILALSGGGAKGAFEAGVISAIVDGKAAKAGNTKKVDTATQTEEVPFFGFKTIEEFNARNSYVDCIEFDNCEEIDPCNYEYDHEDVDDCKDSGDWDLMTGVSAGSLNAVFLATFDDLAEGTRALRKMWAGLTDGDIYSKFPTHWSLYDSSPLQKTITNAIKGRKIVRNVSISATSLNVGKPIIFREFLNADSDYTDIYDTDSVVNALMGSAAIPMIFPPVYSKRTDTWMVDGGASGNVLLDLERCLGMGKTGPIIVDVILCSPQLPAVPSAEIAQYGAYDLGKRNLAVLANMVSNYPILSGPCSPADNLASSLPFWNPFDAAKNGQNGYLDATLTVEADYFNCFSGAASSIYPYCRELFEANDYASDDDEEDINDIVWRWRSSGGHRQIDPRDITIRLHQAIDPIQTSMLDFSHGEELFVIGYNHTFVTEYKLC